VYLTTPPQPKIILATERNSTDVVYITVTDMRENAVLLDHYAVSLVPRNSTRPVLEHTLPPIQLPYAGSYVVRFYVEPTMDMEDVKVFSFPGWLSLAPPIVAIIVSLWLRQVWEAS